MHNSSAWWSSLTRYNIIYYDHPEGGWERSLWRRRGAKKCSHLLLSLYFYRVHLMVMRFLMLWILRKALSFTCHRAIKKKCSYHFYWGFHAHRQLWMETSLDLKIKAEWKYLSLCCWLDELPWVSAQGLNSAILFIPLMPTWYK